MPFLRTGVKGHSAFSPNANSAARIDSRGQREADQGSNMTAWARSDRGADAG